MYFHYFLIISPWKRAWPFIWTNLNPHHPRILCAKFGWNWPCCSWEEVQNVKCLQTDGQTDGRTDRRTNDGQQEIRKAHLTFQLRCAKNCMLFKHCNYNVSKRLLFHNFSRSNCKSYINTTSQTSSPCLNKSYISFLSSLREQTPSSKITVMFLN